MRPSTHVNLPPQTYTAPSDTDRGSETRTENAAERQAHSVSDTPSGPADARETAGQPRIQTVARPSSPDPMQIDSDEPASEGVVSRDSKRKADEAGTTPDRSSSQWAGADSEPQLKRRRTDQGSEDTAPASSKKWQWHNGVCITGDPDSAARTQQLLNALRSEATRDAVYELAFGPPENWPPLDITFRIFCESASAPAAALRSCGAFVVEVYEKTCLHLNDAHLLVMIAPDFDTHRLKQYLMEEFKSGSISAGTGSASEFAPMNFAAKWGAPDIMAALIQAGGGVNNCDRRGVLPLTEACLAGNRDIVQLLLAKGADPDAINRDGWTALSAAAASGRADLCRILLDHGATMAVDAMRHPLHEAAGLGHIDVCRLLLDRDAGIINVADDESGDTALLCAASGGHRELCDFLLARGADLCAISHDGAGLLAKAATSGNIAFYRHLVESGAKPDTPGSTKTPLMTAAESGKTEMVEYLIGLNGDINRRDNNGATALLHATRNGFSDTVSMLLRHGANPDLTDDDDDDALFNAAFYEHTNVIDVLLTHISRTTLNRGSGHKVLHFAIGRLQTETVRCLLQKKLVINRDFEASDKGKRIEHPLLVMALEGSNSLVDQKSEIHKLLELLLSFGAPVNRINDRGYDALMYAAKHSNHVAVNLLLAHGATVGQKNIDDKMDALQIAVSQLDWHFKHNCLASDAVHTLLLLLAYHARSSAGGSYSRLIQDAIDVASHPVSQEILSLKVVLPTDSKKSPLNFQFTDVEALVKIRDALTHYWNADLATLNEGIPQKFLISRGIPIPVLDYFRPYLRSLAQLRPILSGPKPEHRNACFHAWMAGMFANAASVSDASSKASALYGKHCLGEQVTVNLAHRTKFVTDAMGRGGFAYEREKLAPVFSSLFETLLAVSIKADSQPATSTVQDLVFDHLCGAGLFAPLAHCIARAWEMVVAQHTTIKIANFHSSASTHALQEIQRLLVQADEEWKEKLSGDFRQALKRLMSLEARANILRHPQLSGEAAGVYADLMFRQLHMLSQFIEPEKFAQSAQ